MTLQQLKLVIEAVEKGSISAAAEQLNISQPNASLSIKKLEEEVGYPVLRRANGRIAPTEQGYRFLEHAQALLDEDRAIRSISAQERIPRLRVGVMNFSAAIEAFLRFCSERNDCSNGDFMCINASPEEGVKLLKERKLDIIVSVQIKDMMPLVDKVCTENRFMMKKFPKIPTCIRMRSEHPLVKNGMLDGTAKSFRQLGAYPYVDYMHLEHIMNTYNQTATLPFGCSYKIYVDERDTRLRVLKETDAYTVGIKLPEKTLERYGLVSFPTGIEAIPVTFVRKGDEKLPDIARYFDILKEEIEKISTM